MSDIVEQLRSSDGYKVFMAADGERGIKANTELMKEAADEIERLTTALQFILNTISDPSLDMEDRLDASADIARRYGAEDQQ